MPVMDGLEATKKIREREKMDVLSSEPPVCIIGISTNSYADTVDEVLSIGMNDFISKPLSLVQLTECFDRIKKKEKMAWNA
jgi:PleD family two-component response regulator